MTRLRVVLDANVLAPGLVATQSSSAEIVRLWRRGLFDVLVTGVLVEEVAQTLQVLDIRREEMVGLVRGYLFESRSHRGAQAPGDGMRRPR